MSDSVKTQVIRIPPESNSSPQSAAKPPSDQTSGKKPVEEAENVTGIKSNLSPEAKSFLGRLSKAQIIALAAGVPIFGAIAYGVVKASTSGTEGETGGILKDVWNSGGVPQAAPRLVESQPVQGSGPGISVSVTDDQPFKEAFDTARAELGPGNFFIWKGNIYGTYDKEEWDQLSDEAKAEYFDDIPYDKLPDFDNSQGLPHVVVNTTPGLNPDVIDIDPVIIAPQIDPKPVDPEPLVVGDDQRLVEYQAELNMLQVELDALNELLPSEEDIANGNLTEWQVEWVKYDQSMKDWEGSQESSVFGLDESGAPPEGSADMVALRERIPMLEYEISDLRYEIDLIVNETEIPTLVIETEFTPIETDISYFEETATDTGWTTDPQPEDL